MEMREDKAHFACDLYVHQKNLKAIGSGKRLIEYCIVSTGNRKCHTKFHLMYFNGFVFV